MGWNYDDFLSSVLCYLVSFLNYLSFDGTNKHLDKVCHSFLLHPLHPPLGRSFYLFPTILLLNVFYGVLSAWSPLREYFSNNTGKRGRLKGRC